MIELFLVACMVTEPDRCWPVHSGISFNDERSCSLAGLILAPQILPPGLKVKKIVCRPPGPEI